jgi:hypothetical protein
MRQFKMYELERGNLLSLTGMHGREFHVESGNIWLTEQAQPGDHMLSQCQRYSVQGTGRVVIEALTPTRLALIDNTRANANINMKSWWASLARYVRHVQFGQAPSRTIAP